jgi:uncharacterized membrane protein YgcG
MRNRIDLLLKLVFVSLFALLCGAAQAAPSVSINPSYTSVGVNGTVQYAATVSGLSNTAVTWSVSGVNGGNSTYGTITAAGLYKAPAQIPANGVTIGALASDNKTQGVVYVNVAPPGPAISAISPNPLAVGQYSITITGSGFQSNAEVRAGSTVLSATYVSATTLKTSGYQGTAGTVAFEVMNPGSLWGPAFNVTFSSAGSSSSGGSSSSSSSGSSSGHSSSGGSSGSSGSSSSSSSSGGAAQTITPASVSLKLGATQQFTSAGATSWTASAGSISSSGLYTAPATLPSSTTVTIGATGPHGTAHATVTLIPPTPVITAVGNGTLPLGSFTATISGSGFTTQSLAKLNGAALTTTYSNGSLSVTGYASQAGTANVTVTNQSVTSQPFSVQVGQASALATPAAARRLLQQAAFGPSPADAANVQKLGIPGWISQQLAMAPVSNYSGITSSQGGMPAHFMTMAVSNPDQLRQRVAFALSQIFVTSLDKLIWNDNMTLFQNLLLNDAFGNYRQIMDDVTLSPAMGQYLDMANNAKADPSIGSLANENYARELMQLFTIGTNQINSDGSVQKDSNGLPVPAYDQPTVAEFAKVFTGWTYAPAPGQSPEWGAYETSYGPMVAIESEHDTTVKHLLGGTATTAGATAHADLEQALDNIFANANVGPFVGKQLIQHLVKSNPSAAYISRVAAVFNNSNGVRGDMKAVITAVLTDTEARANDQGGADQPTDGHLQEPALFIAGMVRAFGGQMNDQNYYASELASMGQDLFDAPSVFNYYSPNYHLPGVGITGGEFQIDTPNNAMLRANEVAGLMFSAYQKPVQSYGPGTTVDLTPYVSLAYSPSGLIDALDLTLTRGVMPSPMKQILVSAVTADSSGNVHRVQLACYLILMSSYYNVWH